MTPASTDIALRPALAEDCERIYAWQSEPEMRCHFRNPERPSPAEHRNWFAERLGRADPTIWIIEAERNPVGCVHLSPDDAATEAEVSILIARDHQGRGIGVATLRELRLLYPAIRFVAEIADTNVASARAFRRAGFREYAPGRYCSDPVNRSNEPGPQ